MKARYSEENDDSRMYTIIKSTVCFDIGRLFNPEINDITDIYFKAVESGQSWAAQTKKNSRTLPPLIAGIVENFKKIEG